MLACGAVQPDDFAAGVDLAVHDVTFFVAVDATGLQAKRADQEVMAGLDIFVDEQWGDPLRIGHAMKVGEHASAVLDKCDPVSGFGAAAKLAGYEVARRRSGEITEVAVQM